MGIRFTLPGDWEMLRFSHDPDEGSCSFADQNNFRFFLYWQRRKRPPNLTKDAERFLKKIGQGSLLPSPPTPWYGWERLENNSPLRQYARHFPEANLVLTAVFRSTPEKEIAREREVLDSLHFPTDRHLWKIPDFICRVPLEQPMHEAVFQPGKTKLTFRANPKKEPVFTFQKWALTDEWMPTGDVERWLKRQIPAAYRLESVKRAEAGEHQYVSLTATARHRWFPFRFQPRRYFEIAAWICPKDQALYAAGQQLLRPSDNWQQLSDISLGCCPEGPAIGREEV